MIMLLLYGVKLLYSKRAGRFVIQINMLKHFNGLHILALVEQKLW